jgi:hypothetical protein
LTREDEAPELGIFQQRYVKRHGTRIFSRPGLLRSLPVKFGVQFTSGVNQPRTRFDAGGCCLIESFKNRVVALAERRIIKPRFLGLEMFADSG